MIEMGIAVAMMRVLVPLPRKIRMMATAIRAR